MKYSGINHSSGHLSWTNPNSKLSNSDFHAKRIRLQANRLILTSAQVNSEKLKVNQQALPSSKWPHMTKCTKRAVVDGVEQLLYLVSTKCYAGILRWSASLNRRTKQQARLKNSIQPKLSLTPIKYFKLANQRHSTSSSTTYLSDST